MWAPIFDPNDVLVWNVADTPLRVANYPAPSLKLLLTRDAVLDRRVISLDHALQFDAIRQLCNTKVVYTLWGFIL